ncbi:hypothetical protein GW17_00033781 [Ensete ventricosum]|nr:hypothetical protein GW17_00033781 [Ensete ventricosum]
MRRTPRRTITVEDSGRATLCASDAPPPVSPHHSTINGVRLSSPSGASPPPSSSLLMAQRRAQTGCLREFRCLFFWLSVTFAYIVSDGCRIDRPSCSRQNGRIQGWTGASPWLPTRACMGGGGMDGVGTCPDREIIEKPLHNQIDHRREESRGRRRPCVDDRRQDPEEGVAAAEAVVEGGKGSTARPEEPDVGGG